MSIRRKKEKIGCGRPDSGDRCTKLVGQSFNCHGDMGRGRLARTYSSREGDMSGPVSTFFFVFQVGGQVSFHFLFLHFRQGDRGICDKEAQET